MTKTSSNQDQPQQRIGKGDVVAYRYLIRSEAGQVLAASAEVLRYIQGGDHAFPLALSSEFLGRHEGETFTVTLSPEEAFGSRDGPRQLTLPRDRFSELLTLQPGTRIDTQTDDGEEVSVWVVEARGQDVVVDFDHPLAGRCLKFEIAILSIRMGTDAERLAGRPRPSSHEDAVHMAGKREQADPTRSDLGKELSELRRSLVEKFIAEERPGGLHDGMTTRGYGNERQVRGMKDTHLALLDSLDGLAARVVDTEAGVDHRLALVALLQQIARHEDAESALFQDSFQTDLGGEG
jgi:FKBP-type peptidyl-prolyl cis-trans isomerase SlyD